MKYDNPDRRDMLAAEYVLGTLRGAARRRFERLMRDDPAARDAVARWEAHLNPLVEAVPPVTPRTQVWRAIEREIGAGDARTVRGSRGLWESLGFWRGFGLAAAAAAVVLLVYIAARPPLPSAETLAVLEDQGGHAAFVATAVEGRPRLALRAVVARAPEAGRVYELWLLPKGGAKPRALGLLPASGVADFELAPDDRAALPTADGLAISLEPAGGSPTGLPTGPVLFKGAVLAAR
jgi:anti-sigma-K factor RskA